MTSRVLLARAAVGAAIIALGTAGFAALGLLLGGTLLRAAKVVVKTPRVGQHGLHGLALEVHGAPGLFEVPLSRIV